MDVDIDFKTTFDPLDHFPQAVNASRVENGKLLKHTVGAYLQTIPVDSVTGLAAIPYKQAEELGYFKIDFLHLSCVDSFSEHLSKDELRQLCEIDPDWNLLLDQRVVEQLFQVHKHGKVLYRIKPQSVFELADCIAILRPAKRMLLEAYIAASGPERKAMRTAIYCKPDTDLFYYKRSHATAYAMTIVIQLHLIGMGLL